jgi:hypothetical protein
MPYREQFLFVRYERGERYSQSSTESNESPRPLRLENLPSVLASRDNVPISYFFKSIALINCDREMTRVCAAIVRECHLRLGEYEVGTFQDLDLDTLQDLLYNDGAPYSMQRLLENAMGHKREW